MVEEASLRFLAQLSLVSQTHSASGVAAEEETRYQAVVALPDQVVSILGRAAAGHD